MNAVVIPKLVPSSCDDANMTTDIHKSFNSLSISYDHHDKGSSVLGFSRDLLAHLEETRNRLDAWAKEQMDLTAAIRDEANALSKSCQSEIDDKMEEFDDIQRRRGLISQDGEEKEEECGKGGGLNIAKEISDCKEKQTAIESRLAVVHREQYEIQSSINVLTQDERVARRNAEQVRKSKERIEASRNVSVEDLTYAVVKYRMTGLDFVKGKNSSLGCKFTQIDPNNHDGIFTFSLKVTEEDMYDVEDCLPQLDSDVVTNLLNTLNSSADGMDVFPEFIRGMRKAFKNSL